MPDARPHVFGGVRIESDLDVKRVFFDDTKSRFEITLDRKIRRFVERLARFFKPFDALNGECPNLVVLLDESEQIQPASKVHQTIRMDRIALLLLAVYGEILHLGLDFLSYRFHQYPDPVFLVFKVLWRIGTDTNHVVQTVEKLDVPIRKGTFNFPEGRGNIMEKRRTPNIDPQLFAKKKPRNLEKQKCRERQPLVLFINPPIDFPVVPLVIKRKTGLHQRRKIPPNSLRSEEHTSELQSHSF